MTEELWAARIAKVVAGEVRRHRQRRGMSAQQLSDACTQLGHPIARSVLANFESGRRPTVSIPEVLVFARALRVPAVQLVFPLGYETAVDVLPGESVPTWAALKWFTGEDDRFPGDTEESATQDATATRLYREHDRYVREWWDQRLKIQRILDTRHITEHRTEPDPATLDSHLVRLAAEAMGRVADAIRIVRQDMRNGGLILPELDREVAAQVEAPSPDSSALLLDIPTSVLRPDDAGDDQQ